MSNFLGRVGVWLAALGGASAAVERDAAAELDDAGWGTLWIGESPRSKEALVHAGLLLAATPRIEVATGIANIYGRDALAAKFGAEALAEAHGGRFALGLGVSHPPLVEARGADYAKPVATMRAYLDAYEAASYEPPAPAEPAPLILAALGPRMLELARDRSAGAHTYFVPVEHTRRARETLGDGPLLAVELGFVLDSDAERATEAARDFAVRYLALPNYANNLRRLGYSDEEVEGSGSERLIEDTIVRGDVGAVATRAGEHLAAGADHVCLQPIAPSLDVALAWLRETWAAVAEL
jgi:probable F420-dependent oxidoreductase